MSSGRYFRLGAPLFSLALLLAVRAGLLWAAVVPFNSDEAVVALMARHILRGERPLFFYGQAYLGSLDAWLVAGAFQLFGEGVLAVRLVQLALYAGTLLTGYALTLKLTGRPWAAAVTALWLAGPPVVVTLYTTASLGGYGEALLIGNLLWLAAVRVAQPTPNSQYPKPQLPISPEPSPPAPRSLAPWLFLGLLTGIGWWVFPLTAVYAAPAWAYALWMNRRRWAGPLTGLGATMVGALPWLWATFTGAATVAEAGGSALAGVSGSSVWAAWGQHLLSFLLFAPTVVMGLRPPWGVDLLALPIAPVAAVVYSAGGWTAVRRPPAGAARWLWGGSAALVSLAFVLTPFGADPSGRYFLPLVMVLLPAAALFLDGLRGRRPRLALSLALGVLVFNAWGTLQAALNFPPGLTTQFDPAARVDQRDLPRVIEFLRAHGETRGYTNYWVAYPLAFLSGEDLIFAARLPYHEDFRYTARDDRYPPYLAAVQASPRAAYITTHQPALDARLRSGFAAQGVTYAEAQFGDFHVFYALARPVAPTSLKVYAP